MGGRALGIEVEGVAPLYASRKDAETVITGAKKRWAGATGELDGKELKDFKNYHRWWLKHWLTPLPAETDLSLEGWLENTHYSLKRKEELRKAHKEHLDYKDYYCKSFTKREPWMAIKFARWINARKDAFKCAMGPVIKQIEKRVYQLKWFKLKHIPVDQRGRVMYETFGDSQVVTSDYHAFEKSFSKDFIMVCERMMFKYMIRNLPNREELMEMFDTAELLPTKCKHRSVWISAIARMSGDVWTSLFNGYTNLLLMSYCAYRARWKELVGFVEGDDGIFKKDGEMIDVQRLNKLGFDIDIVDKNNCKEAGFCQMYTADGVENLVEPAKSVLKMGWTSSARCHGGPEVMKKLARAKALSAICESPRNPITVSYAKYILRATEGYQVFDRALEHSDWWEMQKKINLPACAARSQFPPPMASRLLTQKLWGISVSEQIQMEKYFDSLKDYRPVCCPMVERMVADRYPATVHANEQFVELHLAGESWRR